MGHLYENMILIVTVKKGTDREEKDYTLASTCQARCRAKRDGGVVGEDIILPQQQIKDPIKINIFMGFLHFPRTLPLVVSHTTSGRVHEICTLF